MWPREAAAAQKLCAAEGRHGALAILTSIMCNCRHETSEEDVKKVLRLGGVGSRADALLASMGGAYYFPAIKTAVQGGLW